MSKIKIKTTLCVTGIDNDKIILETEGIKNDNKIIFKEDETLVTLTLERDVLYLQRKNKDYIIDMRFNLEESYCCYDLKNIGKLNLELVTEKLSINDDKVILSYNMNDNSYNYLVNYEVL